MTDDRIPFEIHPQARKALRACPEDIQDVFGYALLDIQYGDLPSIASRFGEGVDARIWKLSEEFDTDTYRAAYTLAFPGVVYVLHVFKKKSKKGIATPQKDKDAAEGRLDWAQRHYLKHHQRGSP